MAHTPMSDSNTRHTPKDKNPGISLGILATCLILAIAAIGLGIKVRHRNSQLADTQKQLAQAKSDTAKAQGELDQSKAQAADLQTQLDKSKAQATDLQSQLDLSKQSVTQVQAQLDKSKAQTADVQAQLDKAKAQSADLHTQLNQATSGSAQLLTQIDQEKIHSMDLQGRLDKAESDLAQLQPLLLKARHMPVTTSFEKTHGDHFTLHINNLNPQPVTVNVTIAGSGKTRSQSNVIGTASTLNIEKLNAGDSVTVTSDGFDTLNLTAQ
jgi:multidrug efflux pump subunit AcrA (membrane-fusion protein)